VIFGQGFFGLVILALWVYCIFDVISTDQARIQNLPKLVWLLIVVLIPPIGPIAWLLLGRPRGASFKVGANEHRSSTPPPPPPEPTVTERPPPDPDYQRRRDEAIRKHQEEREEELKAREAELRRLEDKLRRRDQGLDEAEE
jgi:hypothetical protein